MVIVIPLAVAVVGGVWWYGSRDHDFLQPPPDFRGGTIDAQAARPPSAVDQPTDDTVKPADTGPPATPAFDPGELITPPTLALYREGPATSAEDLLKLSAALEARGKIQRALLAAERVIDSSEPDEEQLRTAIDAIRRLRPQVPDWNAEPAASFPVTLHAGAGKSTATLAEPLLRELAKEIERASAGILKLTATVTSGRDIPDEMGPPPIAVWFAGPAGGTRSTEVFSFTVLSPETLRDDLASGLLQLLGGHIRRTSFLRIPGTEANDTPPVARLQTHVTRLVWLELGTRLNPESQ